MSQTQDQAGSCFGEAWLPLLSDKPKQSLAEREAQALAMAPPAVRDWVIACRNWNPTIKRGDSAPYELVLPKVHPSRCRECGAYEFDGRESTLVMSVALESSMLSNPRWVWGRAPSVKHLVETWEVMQFRASDAAARFAPHRPLDRTWSISRKNVFAPARTSWGSRA